MANWRVQLATTWAGNGTQGDGANHPLFTDEYINLTVTDETAQVMNQQGKRPKMQAYIIEAEVTEAVLNSLEGDNNYMIFTAEELTDGAP